METLRVTGVLDEALVIVTSDHGHSMWERRGYIGKRGYPSDPESYELPLLVRHPQKARGRHRAATRSCSTTTSPRRCSRRPASRRPRRSTACRSWDTAFDGGKPMRDHVTIGWGTAMTVINDDWWFNAKVNGRGAFLHDSPRPAPDAPNLARSIPTWSSACSRSARPTPAARFPIPAGAGRERRRCAGLQPVRRDPRARRRRRAARSGRSRR